MFRAIRKKKNEIGTEAAEQLLVEGRRGVLAVNGVEGYPYAVPINFYFDKGSRKIYFHDAKNGHKIEALRACDKVCFTVSGARFFYVSRECVRTYKAENSRLRNCVTHVVFLIFAHSSLFLVEELVNW